MRKKSAKSEKNKKKRGCCFKCCMSAFVICLVCAVVIVGVGFVMGNQFAQQRLNMSLGDAFGIVKGILRPNVDFADVYSQEDEEGFYDSLGNSLMFEDGVINKDEVVNAAVASIESGNAEEITSYALALIDLENFEQEKIESIGTDNQADVRLKITSNQLGAFVDGVASPIIGGLVVDLLSKELPEEAQIDYSKLNAQEYVKLEQFKLYEENLLVSGEDSPVKMTTVTVSANFNQILLDLKESFTLKNADSPIANIAIKSLIGVVRLLTPSKLYVTVNMGITHNVQPKIYINDMDDQKMQLTFNLLKIVGLDIPDMLNEIFVSPDGAVAKAMTSANQAINFDRILGQDGLDCDIYQLIIDMAKLNYVKTDEGEVLKPEDEQIHSDDALLALKIILNDNSDYVEQLKGSEYNYKNVVFKRTESGELDTSSGEPVIVEQGAQYYVTDREELNELVGAYEELFLARFSNSYGLKESCTFDEVIEIFTSSAIDENEKMSMFDPDKMKEIVKGEAQGVTVSDKMIAALLVKMLPDALVGQGYDAELVDTEFVYLEERIQDDTHHVIHTGLKLPIEAFLSNFNAGKAGDVVKRLFNEISVLEVAMDITLGAGAEENPYFDTEVYYNGQSIATLDKIFASFKLFGVDENGMGKTLTQTLESLLMPMRELFENLNSTVVGLELQSSAVKLPNVYEALGYALNGGKTEQDEGYVAAATLQQAMKFIVKEGPLADDQNEYAFFRDDNREAITAYNKANEQALLDELSAKYGLDYSNDGQDYTLGEVLFIMGIGGLSDTSRVEGKKIYDLIGANRLKELALTSGNWQESLKVNVKNGALKANDSDADMFTELVRHVLLGGSVNLSVFGPNFDAEDLLFATITRGDSRDFLTITVKTVLKDMVGADGDSVQNFMSDMMPSEKSIVELEIDLSTDNPYKTKVTINGDEAGTQAFFEVIEAFGSSPNLNGISETVRNSFANIRESMDFEVDDYGMLLPNIFTTLNDVAVDSSLEATDEELKDALSNVYLAEQNVHLIVKNAISTQSASNTSQLVQKLVVDGYLLDKDLGASLNNSINSTVGEVAQFNILAANPTAGSLNQADRSWLSGKIARNLAQNKDYMVATLSMDVSKLATYGGGQASRNLKALFDEQVYLTVVFENNDGEFSYFDFAINDMSVERRNIIKSLAGIDDNESSIVNIANDCLERINRLFSDITDMADDLGLDVTVRFAQADVDSARGKYEIIES